MSKRANGEGTISQRSSDKRWIGQITLPNPNPRSNKQIRRTVSAKTQTECRKKLEKLKNQLADNTYVPPTKLTYGEYLVKWLEQKEKLEKLKISTIETHQQRINSYIKPELGHYEIQKITLQIINAFYTKLAGKLSAHTVHKVHAIINNSMKFAKRDGLIIFNPAADALLPKFITKQKQALSSAEITKLLAAAMIYQRKKTTQTKNAYPLIALGINTGMRRGELAALQWSDVDLNSKAITIKHSLIELNNGKCRLETPKTESSLRTIYISDKMADMLSKHREKATGLYVFPAKGKPNVPMSPNNICRFFRTIVKQAGLKCGIHILRHSHITQLLENGINLKTIQDRAGHSNIATTIGYCSPSKEKDKEAAAIFDQFICR